MNFKKKTTPETQLTKSVQIAIPNIEGDGVAEWINVEVPVKTDTDTGEEIVSGEGLRMLADAKARHMGLLLPADLKILRSRLGLSQREIGELLQIGEKTWSRWETGKGRPSRSLNLLLKAVADGVLTIEYLKGGLTGRGAPVVKKASMIYGTAWSFAMVSAENQEWHVAGKESLSLRVSDPELIQSSFIPAGPFGAYKGGYDISDLLGLALPEDVEQVAKNTHFFQVARGQVPIAKQSIREGFVA